jgi:hypothetical protein
MLTLVVGILNVIFGSIDKPINLIFCWTDFLEFHAFFICLLQK